ncbi:MAG: tetratricopeptide repeat protein [Acidobacteriaceae bacterium]|nr:tetratricopeptide repeat protein [Acidobacteriaceae bacterium]
MYDRSLYALVLIFCTISVLGQSQTIGPNGEGSFIAGPEGMPLRVLNEANSWSQPSVVFKNNKIEIFIPDIRTAGWAQSYASAFKKEGTYFTYLYIYGVQSHRTIRETLYVNTRTKIAIVIENALAPPTRVDFCKPDPLMPIDRITAIVKEVSDSFHGQSLDDVIAEQSYTVAKMAACSESPTSQDCTMSDAEFRAKHPRYPRTKTPTEILLSQIAPMTERQPNEVCRSASTTQNAASPSVSGKDNSQNQHRETATALLQDQPSSSDLESACGNGNIDKCYSAGRLFELGQGVPRDYMQAYKYFKQACDGGNIEGCNELGFLFANGFGVARDYQQAYRYGKQACDGGEMLSCKNLGLLFLDGQGVAQDYSQAFKYFKQACNGGNALGCNSLGFLFEHGDGVQQDYTQAFKYLKRACDAGEGIGCANIDLMFDLGNGVTKDFKQAFDFYKQMCDTSQFRGCDLLGQLYENGRGVAQDYGKSLELFKRACDGKDMGGCNDLGKLYRDGNGVAQDYLHAYSLFKQACDAKEPRGCNNLSLLYASGRGVAQDYQQAYKYGQQACDGGSAKGCFDLGAVCSHDRNCTQALEYFAKACNGGIPEGCNQAANYSQLQANQMQALKFYKVSCDDGDSTGCKSYAHLLDDLLKGTMRIGNLHDYEEATLYNKKACNLGEVSACSEAGFLLAYASTIVQGAAPNNQEALKYYNMACDGGEMSVCFRLGMLFEYGHSNLLADGQSLSKDPRQGLSYWEKACDKKDESACTMLQTVQKSNRF